MKEGDLRKATIDQLRKDRPQATREGTHHTAMLLDKLSILRLVKPSQRAVPGGTSRSTGWDYERAQRNAGKQNDQAR